MTDQVIVVDDQLSWARRVGDDVDVRLRLPDAPLEPGTTDVELVTSSKRLRSVADATLEDGVATVAFRVRQSELGPDTWSLEVRTTSHGSFVPLRARLVAAPGSPVALLPGPAPDTRMRPPRPRGRRSPLHRLAARLPGPARNLVRRTRGWAGEALGRRTR